MADKTGIEWTDATWNPTTGCTKVSTGCKHCYAERDWARLVHLTAYAGRAFTDVACHPERLDQPLRWQKPRRIFVNSMSDLFHESIPLQFVEDVIVTMSMAPQHTFQVLTKRPKNMLDVLSRIGVELPENCWIGVSIEDQSSADERIPLLLRTPAAVRWISAEPLLRHVDLCSTFGMWWNQTMKCFESTGPEFNVGPGRRGIDWVVVGGESGPKARPMHPYWVRSLRDQCAAVKVPFLFKQWGEFSPGCDYYTDDEELLDNSTHQPGQLITARGSGWSEEFDGQPPVGTYVMNRTGKKRAGRLLDGQLHDAYPGAPR